LAVIAASMLIVVGLGASLAARQVTPPTVPGFEAASKGEKGNAANSQTIKALKNQNATTTTQPGATTTTKPGSTTTTQKLGIGPTTVTTTPKASALSHAVLAVGDSVMLGAEQSLKARIPGIFVDAWVSRQFWDATAVLQAYKNEGLLPPTIVVHMGTNGSFSDEQFDQMMAVLGKRKVFFVNAREPRTWEKEVNDRLATDVRTYPNAHLIDWHDFGGVHDNWFVSDGIHLTGAGARGYADLIHQHLEAGY